MKLSWPTGSPVSIVYKFVLESDSSFIRSCTTIKNFSSSLPFRNVLAAVAATKLRYVCFSVLLGIAGIIAT